MVEKTAIRFQRGVIGMAETYACEGTLEVGKFLRKGQKGRAPPFEEDMGSAGILLSGEAMHKGSIIKDYNGDLEGRNDSRDLTSVVDSIAQDCEEGELPLIQGLPGFLSTHANAGGEGKGEKVFIHCWKCGRYKRRAVVLQNIVEDWQ